MEEYIYIYIYKFIDSFIYIYIYIHTQNLLRLWLPSFKFIFYFLLNQLVSLLIVSVREGRVLGKQWVWQITDGHLRE